MSFFTLLKWRRDARLVRAGATAGRWGGIYLPRPAHMQGRLEFAILPATMAFLMVRSTLLDVGRLHPSSILHAVPECPRPALFATFSLQIAVGIFTMYDSALAFLAGFSAIYRNRKRGALVALGHGLEFVSPRLEAPTRIL